MDVSSFFNRLVQPAKPGLEGVNQQPDDLDRFEAAWKAIKDTLEHPDERQLVRGIGSTEVPRYLQHLVDALVYESSRTSEDETGACFEYLIRYDILSTLVKLSESDRPHGVKGEIVRALNTLVVLLSDQFLNHNAVHEPLRRLLRSCVGDEPEEGRLGVESRVFGAAGMDKRLRTTSGNDELEADLVDLMCILCSKIRAYPPLLLIFFHDKTPSNPSMSARRESTLTRVLSPTPSAQPSLTRPSTHYSHSSRGGSRNERFEFLLFSYLLRFVHHEGRTGEFARAGLLFLFDIAFLPSQDLDVGSIRGKDDGDALQDAQDALGEYILDGDFAEVMAAAVGAVYSLLPSKVRVPTLSEQTGVVNGEEQRISEGATLASGGRYLGGGTREAEVDGEKLPSTADPDIRSQLDLLLKLFAFLQDIITRCSPSVLSSPSHTTIMNTHLLGAAMSDSTLDAIQTSLLDNILYPSILESSAQDGTSVAVMTYLHVILSNIDDGPLPTRLLHFLLDTDSDEGPRLAPHHQPKRGSKSFTPCSTSSDQQGGERHEYFIDMGKFTMKDLILDNLSSDQSNSRIAAHQLLQTMIQEHCLSTVDGLLSMTKSLPSDNHSSYAYPPEINLYSTLLSTLLQTSTLFDHTPSYSAYLVDITSTIQSDRCFRIDRLDDTFMIDEAERKELARIERRCVPAHQMNPEDLIMVQIMAGLCDWMTRTPDENVELAAVIISLAGCSRRSLEGWMTVSQLEKDDDDPWSQLEKDDYDSEDDNPFLLSPPSTPVPPLPLESQPAIYQTLSSHIIQITHYRRIIPQFDQLLSERRHSLLFAENLNEAMNLNLEMDTFGSVPMGSGPPVTPVRKGRASLARSITGFFSPRKKAGESPATTPGVGLGTPTVIIEGDGQGEPGRPEKVVVDPVGIIGPWTSPGSRGKRPQAYRSISEWIKEERNITTPGKGNGGRESFSMPIEEEEEEEKKEEKKEVSFDQILDNIVILEEFIKEIMAVIIVRRALRVDPVR